MSDVSVRMTLQDDVSGKMQKITANSGLHLRKVPNGEIIALIPNGKSVKSDGKKNGNWYHVKYGSNWGYAYQAYLVKQ